MTMNAVEGLPLHRLEKRKRDSLRSLLKSVMCQRRGSRTKGHDAGRLRMGDKWQLRGSFVLFGLGDFALMMIDVSCNECVHHGDLICMLQDHGLL